MLFFGMIIVNLAGSRWPIDILDVCWENFLVYTPNVLSKRDMNLALIMGLSHNGH